MIMYKITNYGATRTVYIKGQSWEISKGSTIETDDPEVAAAFNDLMFVDVSGDVVKQPEKEKTKRKKKTTKKRTPVRKTKKKKVASRTKRKKIKRRKKKRS